MIFEHGDGTWKYRHQYQVGPWQIKTTLSRMTGSINQLRDITHFNPKYVIDDRIDLNIYYFTVENLETGVDHGIKKNDGKPVVAAVPIFKEILRNLSELLGEKRVNSIYFSGKISDNRASLYSHIARRIKRYAEHNNFALINSGKLYSNVEPIEHQVFLKRDYFLTEELLNDYKL